MSSEMTFMPPDMTVEDARRWAAERGAPVYLVGARDHLVGSITQEQLVELGQ
jgi:hypothetical protein